MIISYLHEFIFLKTQKTAGTSVEIALAAICGPQDVLTAIAENKDNSDVAKGHRRQNDLIPRQWRPFWAEAASRVGLNFARESLYYRNHMNAETVRRRMDPNLFDRFRKVTIVRNPWDREVSLYYWHTRDIADKPPFDRFVRRRLSDPERKTYKIYSIDGRVVADTILRYETLQEDFAAFVGSLGLPEPPALPRAKGNIRPGATRNYRELYDLAAQDIVARRYAREIAAFGYTF